MCLGALASISAVLAACGGGPSQEKRPAHPFLTNDYTLPFVGTWSGSGTVTASGETVTTNGTRKIARNGYNTLSILGLCPGVDSPAGLDSSATFSIDGPVTCLPVSQPCGSVTTVYRSGTGQLQQGTLALAFQGTVSGCGRSDEFTESFSGTLLPPWGLGPPVAVVAPASAVTDPGVTVTLDASGSTDPDGGTLTYSWVVSSQPSGATPILTGAATPRPGFTSDLPGSYRLSLTVTATDGQTANAVLPILVRPGLPSRSYVYLESDDGDTLGAGRGYFYTLADAGLSLGADGGHLSIGVNGDERWSGDFVAGSASPQLEVGVYDHVGRYPVGDPGLPELAWFGEQRTCNTLTGWFAVDSVAYAGVAVSAIDLRFEQHCEGRGPALRGQIHWDATDTTQPPGPMNPPPGGLWGAPQGSTPASGSYVYLESDPGDYAGLGGTYLYTQADAILDLSSSGGRLSAVVQGDQSWSGDFQAMSGLARLEPGYYGDLTRYPEHNPARGGLDWFGAGGPCSAVTGWFAVDAVAYSGTALTAIEIRFEQHCEGGGAALRGQIHWYAADPTRLGPVNPAPAGLWHPAPGTTPASGSYVYLESDPNDFIGLGGTYLYTQADAVLTVTATDDVLGGIYLRVRVGGDQSWQGDLKTMVSLSQIEPGYYGNLRRYPGLGTRGGLAWSGEGRGCNELIGWLVVDSVTYSNGTVSTIDLRFEQHCDYKPEALHGQIHWDASDTTQPPGPVSPPPPGLWEPPPGSTPASSSYVYLEVDKASTGSSQAYVYTQADAGLGVTSSANYVDVTVSGDEFWSGHFQAMSSLAQLQPGYYGGLKHGLFPNPARGWVDWDGTAGCASLAGWFAVDGVRYDGSDLAAIDLRFEGTCAEMGAALRGQVHWFAGDTTQPPGPVSPPPSGLWEPPPGSTPTSGNYVYLESDPGDFVGSGQVQTFADGDAAITLTGAGNYVHVAVVVGNLVHFCFADFQGMNGLTRLQPGYFGNLTQYLGHNPARGGLDWSVDGRFCGPLTGWFVVDDVAYADASLTALDLRFEQHCAGLEPALRGRVHWIAAGP